MNYLHNQDIIHRDLKPLNILFSDESLTEIKLIDFGFACQKTKFNVID